eukprot:6170717-Prymnesium_polylepis.1
MVVSVRRWDGGSNELTSAPDVVRAHAKAEPSLRPVKNDHHPPSTRFGGARRRRSPSAPPHGTEPVLQREHMSTKAL